MKTISISNGFNAHIIKAEKFKTITIVVLLTTPLASETATTNALIAQILGRGCKEFDDISKIYEKAESLYGATVDVAIVKKGEMQIMQFYAEFASTIGNDLTTEILSFLNELMCNPLIENGCFKEEYFQSEREMLRFEIESRKNNKGEYAKLRCLEETFKGEPFSIHAEGNLEDLEHLTSKKCFAQYETLLKQSPVDLVVFGNVNESEIVKKISETFKFGNRNVSNIKLCKPSFKRENVNNIHEKLDTKQGKICASFKTEIDPKSSDYYALLLVNEILGGSPNSELFKELREKKQLCYYVNSFIYRFKGVVFVQSGVNYENFELVVSLISEQIEHISNGVIDNNLIKITKQSLNKKLVGIYDYPSSLIDFHISQYLLDDPDGTYDIVAKIEKVTKEQIANVAKKFVLDTVFCLS